jgi:hypothetical protein
MIQEAFQQRLNATAPTTGHQGYAPTMPHQQNAFGILGQNKSDDDTVEIVATQVVFDMYYIQSHSQQRHRGGLGILIPSF